MGTSRLAHPARWMSTCTFATSLAYLDARGIDRAVVVGVSFGAVVALEAAARHPDRVQTLVAWEPPYGPLGDDALARPVREGRR